MTRADIRPFRRILLWLGLATAGAIVAGCAGKAPRLDVREGVPWPVLCRSLQNSWGRLNTFESELRFSFDSELASLSGWGKIAYSSAGVLVLQLRGPLGVRAADVVATTDSLWVYVPFRNTLYVGGAEDVRFAKEEPGRWVQALFGRPALQCDVPGQWRPRGEKLLTIEQPGDLAARRYVVDRDGGEVRELRFSWGDGYTVVVEYEGTNRLSGCLVARLVRVKSDSPKVRLAIAYQRPRVNRRINWKRYKVSFPPSARRVALRSIFLVSERVGSGVAQGD